MKLPTLSAGQLRRAAHIRDQIEALDREYLRILGFGIPEIKPEPKHKPKLKPKPKKKKVKFTPEQMAIISGTSTKRWSLSRELGSKKLLSNKEIEARLAARKTGEGKT